MDEFRKIVFDSLPNYKSPNVYSCVVLCGNKYLLGRLSNASSGSVFLLQKRIKTSLKTSKLCLIPQS